MVYDTEKSLENDIRARTLNNDKSYILYIVSNWGKMHHYTTCLSLIFSAVQTSKTSFQITEECTIKRPRFKIMNSKTVL